MVYGNFCGLVDGVDVCMVRWSMCFGSLGGIC